jgi:hypothetical protein
MIHGEFWVLAWWWVFFLLLVVVVGWSNEDVGFGDHRLLWKKIEFEL